MTFPLPLSGTILMNFNKIYLSNTYRKCILVTVPHIMILFIYFRNCNVPTGTNCT